jgi:hypothetical protein
MKELSAFKRINLLKCCDIGSRTTHFGLPRVKIDLQEMGMGEGGLIDLAQVAGLVNVLTNPCCSIEFGEFLD